MIWSLSAWLCNCKVFFLPYIFKTKFSIKCEFFKAKQPFLNSTRITRTFPFLPFLKSNFRIDFRESRKSLFHGPNAILQISYGEAPSIFYSANHRTICTGETERPLLKNSRTLNHKIGHKNTSRFLSFTHLVK